MLRLRCACLVAEQNNSLLLVRVRENAHWYLPGGKIEVGESAEAAMIREVAEELGIHIEQGSSRYLYTVIAPAYGQAGEVELVCFTAQWQNIPQPLGEISEVAWLPLHEQFKFAPAVQTLCKDFLHKPYTSSVL
ncbi:MAG: hypothetical protein RL571_464 [Pseudomonadota bacterium]|jgi:8-oxo-dGTP pyrophosphatase MutT (NUDIX family)